MPVFEIKSDLPLETQNKIDYIEAIPSAKRTTNQANFLTALAPYLTNVILSVDETGLIISAAGLTVPTGYEGFRKGATFVKTDATTKGTYENVGDDTSATWDLIGQSGATDISIAMTEAARDLLTPATGMLVFNTTASELQVYYGAAWHSVSVAA